MKQKFIKLNGSGRLVLFFAGWGMDERPFTKVSPDADFMICYDYSDMDFSTEEISGYSEIKVVAWSMGVFAASIVSFPESFNIISTVAFNGTTFPVDDTRGIPQAIFEGTLANITGNGVARFDRRMCSREELAVYKSVHPERSLESLYAELKNIYDVYKTCNTVSQMQWDNIFIGDNDLIIPTRNQQEAWSGHDCVVLGDCCHYSGSELKRILETW